MLSFSFKLTSVMCDFFLFTRQGMWTQHLAVDMCFYPFRYLGWELFYLVVVQFRFRPNMIGDNGGFWWERTGPAEQYTREPSE